MTFELEKYYKCQNGEIVQITQIGKRDRLVYTGLRTMEFVQVEYFFAKHGDKRIYFNEDGLATSFLDTPYEGFDILDKTPVEVEVIL